jgi:serine/threonine-protein kinase HipA
LRRCPSFEWLCLTLGRACGFDVPDIALINMPDQLPLALVVERFDIREGENETRRFALEDFCSVLELPTASKYDGTIDRVARQGACIPPRPMRT